MDIYSNVDANVEHLLGELLDYETNNWRLFGNYMMGSDIVANKTPSNKSHAGISGKECMMMLLTM